MPKFDNVKKVLVEEMYENCWDCPFAHTVSEHGGECGITGTYLYLMDDVGRPDDCPLMLQDEMANWFFFSQPVTPEIKKSIDSTHKGFVNNLLT
jgi:hypothetical protein